MAGILFDKAVEDQVAVQRALGLLVHVDQGKLGDATLHQVVDQVAVEHVSGAQDLLLLAVDLGVDVLVQVAAVIVGLGILGELDFVALIELGDNLLTGIEPDRSQEERAKNPLAAVDLGVDQVLLLINLKLQPGSAVWNDFGRADALLVGEDDAGTAMDLADNDTLGTIDDEGTAVGHKRNIAKEDFLLTNLAIGELQADRGLQRHAVGASLLLALALGELDVVEIELIALVHQSHFPIRDFNRERGLKDLLEAEVRIGRLSLLVAFSLQEAFITFKLDSNQVGKLADFLKIGTDVRALNGFAGGYHHLPSRDKRKSDMLHMGAGKDRLSHTQAGACGGAWKHGGNNPNIIQQV